MSRLPVALVWTEEDDFARRLQAYLAGTVEVRWMKERSELERALAQFEAVLVLADMRTERSDAAVLEARKRHPDALVIAFADEKSDPAVRAAAMGVYAVEPADAPRRRLQLLVRRAQGHLRLVEENRRLLVEARNAPAAADVAPVDRAETAGFSALLDQFSRAHRRFEDIGAMLHDLVAGVAQCARVSRVGIFALERHSGTYVYRAGIRCLGNARDAPVRRDDPLVRWLELNAAVLSRDIVASVEDAEERTVLRQCLDACGAEVIVPLYGREGVVGWLFTGRRVTGRPFRPGDLEALMQLGDHVSVALENACLYEEVAIQRTLAETVLQSIPVGIVAVGSDSRICAFNRSAEAVLGIASPVVGQPAEKAGSVLAGLLLRCAGEGVEQGPLEWRDAATGRCVSAVVWPLGRGPGRMGAVAILRDMTRERALKERQEQLERAAFWAELAAAMSHEVRNPLVAISTFAQLLPERYEDAEFREQFGRLVTDEIARLNGMIDQLDAFANPREPVFRAVRVKEVVDLALQQTRAAVRDAPGVEVQAAIDPELPPVWGDREALAECLRHLIFNAVEAVTGKPSPRIEVRAAAVTNGAERTRVCLEVRDNGKGIPPDLRDRVFSPFCTSKVRGIGLGLPIARRIALDHSGYVDLESGSDGSSIRISLPTCEDARRELK